MNARIQVEHPITEAITGFDLVAEQIAVAEGQRLRIAQDQVRFSGHAMELRINAEDAEHDFRPSPGTVSAALFPAGDGIRVDTHIEPGSRVPPFYDSLLAKIIVSGADRERAIAQARIALDNCRIEGLQTNLASHRAVLGDPEFMAGGVDTNWFERFHAKGSNT
jgi:acetyl-CoA carboxylase biotin carboxylase subunit